MSDVLSESANLKLKFESGTLILEGATEGDSVPEVFVWDQRTRQFRAPAYQYRQVIKEFIRTKTPYEDFAKKYATFDFKQKFHLEPRPYQTASIEAWRQNERCGTIVLPTGAGKTHAATMAIEICKRQTLIVVPTIDLMNQWYDLLLSTFNAEIGLIGGGFYEIGAITVTTYASAFRHQERIGNQFGLIIFDECHHLPSEGYKYAAEFAIAPFRMGLSATPDRADGNDSLLEELVGKFVYRLEAQELAGEYLADYTLERIEVDLSFAENELYQRERGIFRDFVRAKNIPFGSIDGWKTFIMQSARSEDGRRAMKSYRNSKKIALGTDAKLRVLQDLLIRHKREKVLIFTAENEMVYQISNNFLIPAITHETNIKERRFWLEALNKGDVLALATSKVLNEGVNIPDASVAIILSGSGSSREHIQRLGRILRKKENKQAILYEVVTRNTTEEYISQRRTDARQFQDAKTHGNRGLFD
ncbi:MAG: DEAD/DEAH box helicase family protein [Acidobacteriota bacterium]|jgi:superfamily II DNA or RNA helicase|nr:DEAD/DEAH box helicase family protein [Acidobacteriota bacterium]